MQFPEIPDDLPTSVKNHLNRLRKKYGGYMISIRFNPPFADELLKKAEGLVEQAERMLNDQAQSSRTADPGTSADDD
ncbi:MAG: hypothetical protein VXZ72_02305 [Chlamydiota bacterium]|nr:hypothetical protein [Chlamydiota bacterium]